MLSQLPRHADDVVVRYGGEEIVIVMPATGLDDAAARCERLRANVEQHPWSGLPAGDALPLGFVVGGGAVVGDGTARQAGGEPQRVGGDIVPPTKIVHVAPVYPEIARIARVSGVVVVDCTIDPAGNVVGVRVLSGNPLLAPAAVQAVSRWTYTPSRLNGVPVSVLMTVTVRFDLKR